ncbi:MAG: hypothetical protein QXG16_01330 [Candidatus Anstonellaceae archaeon]
MTCRRLKKGQVSIEQILILGFVLLVGILILNFFGFFADPIGTKINQSKIYWSSISSPFKLTEFGIYKHQAADGVLFSVRLKITNPTNQKLTIRKLEFSSASFADVYQGQNYLGKTNNLYLTFFPSESKIIDIYSFEPNSKPNLYNPSKVFESYLTIYFDSALLNQIQQGSVPLVDYISPYEGSYSQYENIFNNETGCPTGFIPCPDVQNCVPDGYCLSNGSACLPPNIICNNDCCQIGEICYNGACVLSGSINCNPPNILCGPDPTNSYYCCNASNSICDQVSKQCVVCTSPNSIPCNRVCCPDGQFCNQQTSSCLSSCSPPNFVCPAGSSNCCNGSIFSYCDPLSGSCLSTCNPPNIVCGPDENGITYCCDSTTSICNTTTNRCQSCPSGVSCNNQCCKQNYICLGENCFCPLPQRYYIGGEEFCCPPNHIYNYTTQSCEPCQQPTISCLDKCCEANTICDISNTPTTSCVNCCPANTFNCEDKYCCKYKDACINGQCVNYCLDTQIACPRPDGSIICCNQNSELCSQPDGACIPTASCEPSQQCGKFCCKGTQFCYDGRCVDSYPQPPKCPDELFSTCPQSQTCGLVGVDEFGNPIIINETCCPAGYYCANYTGQCCAAEPCPRLIEFTTSTGSVFVQVGECCASGSACYPQQGQDLSNQTCCDYQPYAVSYTYREGEMNDYNQTTQYFSNFCGIYCCPNGTGCINSTLQICCSPNQTCRIGNSISGYNYTCCPSNSICGSIQTNPPSSNYGDLTYVCCPENRQCNLPRDSNTLPSTCCPEGKTCINDFCCEDSRACRATNPENSICCDEGKECIYSSTTNSSPICCELSHIYGHPDFPVNLSKSNRALECCPEPVSCIDNNGNLCGEGIPILDPIQKTLSCPENCQMVCRSSCSPPNQLCNLTSGVECCTDPEKCLKKSSDNQNICCPSAQQAYACENGALPNSTNCPNEICCMDSDQLLDLSGFSPPPPLQSGKYCCVNDPNSGSVFVACGNSTSQTTKSVCCEANKCKTPALFSDYSICCPSQEDILCQIKNLSDVNPFVCCPKDRCIKYNENLQPPNGLCCPESTIACVYSAIVPPKVECCNLSISVCSSNPDPDNQSTICCPIERFAPVAKTTRGGFIYQTGPEYICCSNTQVLRNFAGRPSLCCPEGTIPISDPSLGKLCCSYSPNSCVSCPPTSIPCLSGYGDLLDCCDPSSVCLGGERDPDYSNSHCCPVDRYLRSVLIDGSISDTFVCCSTKSKLIIEDNAYCCPQEYIAIGTQCCKKTDPSLCISIHIGGDGGGTSP